MPSTQRYQIRDAVSGPVLSPPWLSTHGSLAEKYMYLFGIALDVLLEKMNEASQAHCPGYADPTAIPLQASDRQLVQGPLETDAEFVFRLRNAIESWSRAGSRASLLEQIQGFITGSAPSSPDTVTCEIVGGTSTNTRWDTVHSYMAQGSAPEITNVNPPNWNWDNKYQSWREWLVIFMSELPTGLTGTAASFTGRGHFNYPANTFTIDGTSNFIQVDGLAGLSSANNLNWITFSGASSGANNGAFQIVYVYSATQAIIACPGGVAPDGHNGAISWSIAQYPLIAPGAALGSPLWGWGADISWGFNVSSRMIQTIRKIVRLWKSAGTYYKKIIISFDGGDGSAGREFSPLSSEGAGNPDGTWGAGYKIVNGYYVPSRVAISPLSAVCDGSGQSHQCYIENVT